MERFNNVRVPLNKDTVIARIKTPALILGGFILLIWSLELLDWIILDGALDTWGVRPRSLIGLRGILLMPFLHGSIGHVLANTLPFLILGGLVMLGGVMNFFIVVAITMLVSGFGVWLFGSSGSIHIGASGLIFGFFGFLLTRAYLERSISSIILAIVVFLFYGGIIWGVLPFQNGVSWLGHLFGFFGGMLAAYLLVKRRRNNVEAV